MPSKDVFFDPTGHRWPRIKGWTLAVIVILTTLTIGGWSQARQPPTVTGREEFPRPDLTGLGRPEEVGTGPLIRLARIQKDDDGQIHAVDPFTGQTLGPLSERDAEIVETDRFALYRYGYGAAAHRTISLTFDDGPDPIWTPKILDLLHRHGVPATFFVVGSQVVRHPEMVERAVREGHEVANHTMTHPELEPSTVRGEIGQTDRIISAITGVRTTLFRLPYDGAGPAPVSRPEVIAEVQRQGYLVSMEDFDTRDWMYGGGTIPRPDRPMELPPTTMDNITVLLHDAGGDRAETLAYLERLIPWAKGKGYAFHTLSQVSPDVQAGTRTDATNVWDSLTLWTYQARWLGPGTLLRVLFLLAIVSVVVGGMINIALATGRRKWYRHRFGDPPPDFAGPPVTAVVPAYNEEKVIARALDAVCRSRYANLIEIIVVDDGSTDRTADVVAAMAARDNRIRLVRQPNSGKPLALNNAFTRAQGEIIITLDADTILSPSAISYLVHPFTHDPGERLGAVAGRVSVGNLRGFVTRWQGLEYVMQIGVDRGAQDALNAITIVPGACGAWRRNAVISSGGYSPATLAEDCDLALELRQQGYSVSQSGLAVGHTEAPESLPALIRQRFRWTYGNFQSLWKHRRMVLNPEYGWLGMLVLPATILSLLMPVLFLPFVYVMAALAIQEAGLRPVLVFGGLLVAAQFLQALAGVILTKERAVHLLIVPLYRLFAEPLRAYLLYRTAFAALRGTRSRWNKLQRTGTVRVAALGNDHNAEVRM